MPHLLRNVRASPASIAPPLCNASKVSIYSSGTSALASKFLTRLPRPPLFFFVGVKPQGEASASAALSPNIEEPVGLGFPAAESSSKREDFGRAAAAGSSSPKRDMVV